MSLPPLEVLDAAGVDAAGTELMPWRVPIWKVRRGEQPAVLRRTYLDALCSEADIRWQHRLQLTCLARGLPVPRPMRVFGDGSVLTHDGFVWELLTYLPGRTMGWQPYPSPRDVGATLARFHTVVADLASLGQRPSAVPLSQLDSWVDLNVIDASLPDMASRRSFRRHLEEVGARAADIGAEFGEGLIHGDFTTLNLLVDGEPPKISAIIDFNNAYVETPLADVGFCLWQAGRPARQTYVLDPQRVADIVGGYSAATRLPRSAAPGVVDAIAARGLQLMVRSSVTGARNLRQPLQLVEWIVRHRTTIEDNVSECLS